MNHLIVQANSEHGGLVAPLFDAYRVFYGQPSDLQGAEAFVRERLSTGDSVIFLAVNAEQDAGLAFAQLYPSFSSVAMRRVWILNDLFVAEFARRTGLARALLHEVLDFAGQSGAARIDLATAKDNLAAQALYDSAGYKLDLAFDHYRMQVGVRADGKQR